MVWGLFCLLQNWKLAFLWAEKGVLLRAEGLKLVNCIVQRSENTLHFVP